MMAAQLFDATWYRENYPEIADYEPWEHFQRIGAAAGLDPNSLFSTSWYLRRYPAVAGSGLNPLEDYVSHGVQLGRDPGPLFSTQWYLANNPDVAAAGVNPLEHYLFNGWRELRDPSPVFNTTWYLASYPSAAGAGMDARLHYMEFGALLGYSPCAMFESQWYLDTYPDVAAAGVNPLLHYLTEGAILGYDPSPIFSTLGYLDARPEVAVAGVNPLVHYLINQSAHDRNAESTAVSLPNLVSREAIAETREIIRVMSPIESDLISLPTALEVLPVATFAPDRCTSAWRRLYLSIDKLPQKIVLVGSIDDASGLAALVQQNSGMLIVETDAEHVSTAEVLPPHTCWRSLAEFEEGLDEDDRVKIVTALINSLQPLALLIWGSRAGWEMLSKHGSAIGSNTALFAAMVGSLNTSAEDLLRRYFRTCVPVISALYSADKPKLQQFAGWFGLPPSEDAKLQDLRQCSEAGGFLAHTRTIE